ncbi:hypothetical protein BH11PSE2_BH11PSE2_13580 [soil metagenome]
MLEYWISDGVGVGGTARKLRVRRSIREKLIILVLASVGAAVVLVAGITTWRDARRDAALQTERLANTAKVMAAMSSEAVARKDVHESFRVISAIAAMPEITYARVEGENGVLLSETGRAARLVSDIAVVEGKGGGFFSLMRSQSVQIEAPVIYAKVPVGKIVLLGKLEGAAGRLGSSLLISLLAALAATATGLMIAARLQRRIAGPIVALTRSMAQVQDSHDYSQRVEVASDDEVGELVGGFNRMLDEIGVREAALAEHLAGLERTVEERTLDLREAKDSAEAANSAKSDFLATMSHEIRTPMNGIMVVAEMLAAGEMPPKQRRFAEVIAKSGSSLLAIINDILDFSKIEAGKMDLEATAVDPAEVAEDVCSLFWEKARSKGLDLAAYIDPACPRLIEADQVRMRQVVGNLINNAIKFTETGCVLVQVRPGKDGKLIFAVHDTGIGIPQDKIPTVFGAFSQADQSTTRKFGGTGLGLAICKRLVDAMGGRFKVTSEVGKGSVFAFEIPATVLEAANPWPTWSGAGGARVALSGPATLHAAKSYLAKAALNAELGEGETALTIADPAALKAQTTKAGPTICIGEYGDSAPAELVRQGLADLVLVQPLRRGELEAALRSLCAGDGLPRSAETEVGGAVAPILPSFAGRRVLVADDSAVNREVAMEALSRLDVVCAVAVDGREAADMALAETFDLILMDGSMPEMDGYESSRAIRAAQAEAGQTRTPIVALTAHVVGSAAEAWREADMDAVLHKPFTLAGLAKSLGQFLPESERPTAPITTPVSEPAASALPAVALSLPDSDLFDGAVTAELKAMAAAGRADFVERVQTLYRDNAPGAMSYLIAAAGAGDVDAAARAAHALKSMSFNIGAKAVADLAGAMEGRARDRGQVSSADAETLHRTLLATIEALSPKAPGEASQPQGSAEDRALLADLEGAAERGEFTLNYQTQIARDGQTIFGAEALLRWTHPVRGPVSPALFIPLAEQAGMIRPITHWVLDQLMAETADLDIDIGFNASALEFADPGFVDELAMMIARRRFDPKRLIVEVTETAILADAEEVRRNMQGLHDIGVRIALDDFGVGFSSLNHLRLFPFDKLKIDRAFVTECCEDVQSATLIHGLVSIGRALGMKVVAEGVETETQRTFLKAAGVHAMQGYLFSKPVGIDVLREILAAPQMAKTA